MTVSITTGPLLKSEIPPVLSHLQVPYVTLPGVIYLCFFNPQTSCTPFSHTPYFHEEELLYSESDGALAEVAQGGCGVSFSGDIQDPPGRGPMQLAVGDPTSAGGGWTR